MITIEIERPTVTKPVLIEHPTKCAWGDHSVNRAFRFQAGYVACQGCIDRETLTECSRCTAVYPKDELVKRGFAWHCEACTCGHSHHAECPGCTSADDLEWDRSSCVCGEGDKPTLTERNEKKNTTEVT